MKRPWAIIERPWAIIGRDETGVGHKVIVDRIPEGSWVLDAGCRRYDFVDAILHLEKGCKVLAVDVDKAAYEKRPSKYVTFIRAAVMAKYKRSITVNKTTDNSTFFVPETRYGKRRQDLEETFEVPCVTIPMLMKQYKIKEFSVVKFDIEGAEYDILLNWPGPIADQISVEFHDAYPGRNPFKDPEQYYRLLFKHLKPWYEIVYHRKTGPFWASAYWDSLFVRK